MEERMKFVIEHARGEVSMAELCRRYGVSRKTGYNLIERYGAEGVAGLADRSRAPHSHPQAVAEDMAAAVLAVRHAHRTWGPRKVRAYLMRIEPELRWPAASTIGALFDREGLTVPRRRRLRVPPRTAPLGACSAANEVWTCDFKGWFLTGDGTHCEPFTLQDAHSRYLLRCQMLVRNDTTRVWSVFDAAFREFGLPGVMRSDNGPPFAGRGLGGLSRLAVRLIKAGVMVERIDAGKPQQNGRHERLHLTLKQDTASPPAPSLLAQARRFAAFRRLYNDERPHEALGQTPPADHYAASPRRFSGRISSPDYPADHQVRRVRSNGEIKWRGGLVFLTEALTGEPVGLEETDDGLWTLRFGPLKLCAIDHHGRLIKPHRSRGQDKACGFDGHRSRDAHNPTGPTTSTGNET